MSIESVSIGRCAELQILWAQSWELFRAAAPTSVVGGRLLSATGGRHLATCFDLLLR